MGKTKTAFVGGTSEENLSGEEKYKKRLEKKKESESKKKVKIEGLGLKGGERIKIIGSELPPEPQIRESLEPEKGIPAEPKARQKRARVKGRNYKKAKAKIDKTRFYPIPEAIKLVKETSYSRFDGTMEMHLVVKKTGISIDVQLPHFAGRQRKIEVASDSTIEKLKEGKIDFDLLLATTEMMPKLVPFARLLGPRGLMPNPKNQTLIKSKKDVGKFSVNSITIKTEKEQPIIHTVVGKVSQKNEDLEENIKSVIEAINPKQILKAYLKSTMSPSIKIAIGGA